MTTYILGAGASVSAGYPVTSTLWPRLVAYAHSEIATDQMRRAFDAIGTLYGPVLDIEAALSALDRGDGVFTALSGEERLHLTGSVRTAIAGLFESIRLNDPRQNDYCRFARTIAPGDTVVTFNYDVALDAALAEAGFFSAPSGYCFALVDQSSQVRVLKPHGSVNWFARLFDPAEIGPAFRSMGSQPFVDNTNASLPNHSKALLPNSDDVQGQTGPAVSLILPVHSKRFSAVTSIGEEWIAFYRHLWTTIAVALSQSDHIVIIGYSMPNADKQARGIILSHSSKNARVRIFSGNASEGIGDDFFEHGFVDVTTGGRFEDFLNMTEFVKCRSRRASS